MTAAYRRQFSDSLCDLLHVTAIGRLFRRLAVAVVMLLSTANLLHAATATAQWNANPEPDIAGYRLLYGIASGVYTTTLDVGNVTTYNVTGLTPGTRYYFVVQAYNTSAQTGPNSSEV